MSMWQEFKDFLFKQNAIALAIGVVIGIALNALVQSIVNGFVMPLVGLVNPNTANWATSLNVTLPHGKVLDFATIVSALINFIVIGFVCWRISKLFIKPAAPPAKAMTTPCPYCRLPIDPDATRCPNCTSQLGSVSPGAPAMAR